MTNNIIKIKRDLRAYAKRCKDVHYTEGLAITFLITGMLFATRNLFSASAGTSIENQKQAISTSIKTIHQQVKATRKENDKLLKSTNLELIQLMEQGDHVVKAPWSSWQYGINYMNNNWNGTYKGRGDKKAKYPYEGVYQRSLDIYERSVSPDSSNYGLLSRNRRPNSASGSAAGYGVASFKPVKEPIVPFEVNAGIRPRSINKSAIRIADKTAVTPTLPETISFTPPSPVIGLPELPDLPAPPNFNIQLGSYCNRMRTTNCGDKGTNGGAYNGVYQNYAVSISGGTVLGTLTDGHPSLRYSWSDSRRGSMNPSVLLKSYFDLQGTYTLSTSLTISSINPVANDNTLSTDNRQVFLVGGSRIATLDNAPAGSTLTNATTINLEGPLTVGFEAQTDNLGSGSKNNTTADNRSLVNSGIITDANETTSAELDSKLVKGGQITLTGNNATTVTRTAEGYTGYKIGLILTREDKEQYDIYNLINNSGGIINFQGENSIGIQIYAPYDLSTTFAANVVVSNNTGGTIKMGGEKSYGMKWSSRVSNSSTMENNGTIIVSGDAGVDNDNKPINSLSSGIAVIENEDLEHEISIRAWNGKVKNNGEIKVSGGKGNTGMVLIVDAGDDITNDANGTITVSSIAKRQNIAMRVDRGTEADTDAMGNLPKAINNGTINLDGDSSIGMVGKNADVINNANKTIGTTSGKNIINGIGMATSGGSLTNNGTITLEGTGVSSNVGAYMTKGTGNPTGTFGSGSAITVKGTDSTGVLITNGTLSYQGTTEAQGDGVTGLLVGDNGSKTATVTAAGSGTVTVNGGNAATSAGVYENDTTKVKKGSYGIVVGKGSSLVSSGSNNVNVVANVKGAESIGLYSGENATLEVGDHDVKAYDGAVNYDADKNSTIN